MQIDEVLAQARESLTVKRVFGEPIERDGVTVIPVANVMGGGGGGGGVGPASVSPAQAGETGQATDTGDLVAVGPGMASGSGVGYGVRATPAGVYVIRDGEVEWQPAVDTTRVMVMGRLIGIFFLFVAWRLMRAWIRR
jgi:uncharacterized spore protein YtfJ